MPCMPCAVTADPEDRRAGIAGTLLLVSLKPGKRLYLLATGTGLAPFVSIARGPEAYERFEHIALVHGRREVAGLVMARR